MKQMLIPLSVLLLASCQEATVSKKIIQSSAMTSGMTTTFSPYRAINLNGPVMTINGVSFEGSDAAFGLGIKGTSFAAQSTALIPATDVSSASMIRSSVYGSDGSLKISLQQVPNGTYQTSLYVWEDNDSGTYSITLNGEVVQSNFVSGSAGSWKKLGPWKKEITNGLIELSTTGSGDANFSGIVVEKVTETTAPSEPSSTLTKIGMEGGTFTVAPNTIVRYGTADKYVEKVVSGTFNATNEFFGSDPAYGIHKTVWTVGTAVVVTPTPTPAPTPIGPASCAGSGTITLERWTNVAGEGISNIPLLTTASSVSAIQAFEISELGDNYGSRISGYVCAPYSGNYTFYISGDDSAELFLGTSEDKTTMRKVAYYNGWTPFRDLYVHPTQKSAVISLEAGKKYYVQAHHKEGSGGDSVSVGWMLPNGQMEFPLPAGRILPANVTPVVAPAPAPAPAPTPTPAPTPGTGVITAEPANYSGPIVITKGGTYTGNWKSTNMDVPAVEIKTSEPVTIINSHMAGPGNLIEGMWLRGSLVIRNSSFHGKTPTRDNESRGKAIQYPTFKNLVVENNFFENTGTVVGTDGYSGNGTAAETVKVRFNKVRNIDGRHRNGFGRTFQNFVGIQNYMEPQGNPRFGEIAWNDVINEPNQSSTEDLINFYQAGGRSDSAFKIHNNFLKGSYPNPANNPEATGSGIQIDGKDHNKTSHIEAHDNTIMQTLNGGMGMAAGNNVYMHDNRVISTGKFPDGSWMPGNFAGVWIFDFYSGGSVGSMYNNRIENNVIGWANPNYTFPHANRLDWHSNLGGGIKNNTHLPNMVITPQTEVDEYNRFLMKAQNAGIKFGPQP